MGAKPAAKQKTEGPSKHATSQDCVKCQNKCPRGRSFLSKLECKNKAKCPVCPLK